MAGIVRKSAEIAIVGGGPVGMGLAIELGLRGIRVCVVERYPTPQPVPKGQNLTQRTMEHFRAWGIEEELRAARTVPREYGIGGLTAYGTLLGDYRYDWLQRELVRPYYATDNERLPQYATEEVLRSRAAELDTVEIVYGRTASEIRQAGDGVVVEAEGPDGRVIVDAAFVVGCDGSRSLVRERAGISQTRIDHDRLMALVVFRSAELHRLLERFPGKSFYNVLHPDLEGYWQFFGRVDLGETFFFHAPVPVGATRENFDFTAYLHRAVGREFAVDFDYVGFWDLRIAVADAYRAGRVFIAGDAAHSHPPYGGYGINTGFEDARNLGWKLAAVLRGWGGPALLDSYDAERRPVFASTARDFIERSIASDREFLARFDPVRDRPAFEAEWSARGSGARDEVASFAPHYSSSPVVVGGEGQTSAVGRHDFSATPGHHLPPVLLPGGMPVHDRLGPGFTLLCAGAPAAQADAFSKAAAAAGIPLTILDIGDAADAGRYGASMVLVRPDDFVAWAGDAARDAAAILLKAAGH